MKKITIQISAQPVYLADLSSPDERRFLWSYEITVENKSEAIVQLLNRYWRIFDMAGNVEEVRGPGVIGLQPIIKPEKKFVYTSFCQLQTPQGAMEGHYEMQTIDDEMRFSVQIPKFILTCPSSTSQVDRSKLH